MSRRVPRRSAGGHGRRAGVAWSPLSIPGLYVWHRADNVTLVTGDVSVWPDLSGNGRDSTQGTAANRPTWLSSEAKFGGRPALRFVADGVEQNWLDMATLAGLTTAAEVFVVVATEADASPTTARAGLWVIGTAASASYYAWTDGASIFDAFGSSARHDATGLGTNFSNPHVYSVWSAASDWQSKIDGVNVKTDAVNTVACSATPDLGRASDSWLDGRVAEFLLYSRKLTAAERNAVLTYLGSRYAIVVTLS